MISLLKAAAVVAVMMAVMWASEANEFEIGPAPDGFDGYPVVGDLDGDGYTDLVQYRESHPAGIGVYVRDGWCQCWISEPIAGIEGTGWQLDRIMQTPEGPRLEALQGGIEHQFAYDVLRGEFVEDTTEYEPPTATFQIEHVAPKAWFEEYSYGSACGPGAIGINGEPAPSQCSEPGSGPSYGYGWKVYVTPATEIETMQISHICVRARLYMAGGPGHELFCTPVDWADPGDADRRDTHFDYQTTGTLEWRPMLWDGTPLANAWCSLEHGDSIEWQADAHHKGGVTTTTGWATMRIWGCSQ